MKSKQEVYPSQARDVWNAGGWRGCSREGVWQRKGKEEEVYGHSGPRQQNRQRGCQCSWRKRRWPAVGPEAWRHTQGRQPPGRSTRRRWQQEFQRRLHKRSAQGWEGRQREGRRCLERRSSCELARPRIWARQTRLGRGPLEDPCVALYSKKIIHTCLLSVIFLIRFFTHSQLLSWSISYRIFIIFIFSN